MKFYTMRNVGFFLLATGITLFSCRKPTCNEQVVEVLNPCAGSYEQHTSSEYDSIWSAVFNSSIIIGPFTFLLEGIANQEPVFNPNNSNEIAFVKTNYLTSDNELWKFDFCTGESTLIVDNFYYNLNWGSNGWLIYTGSNQKIHKVKSNGDSLTVLSDLGGINSAGKWNPSGTMYWNEASSFLFKDFNGNLIHEITVSPIAPFGWLNDSTLLGWKSDNIYALEIPSEELTLINDKTISIDDDKTIDLDNMICYSNTRRYLIRYFLDGSNQSDTVKNFVQSYMYGKMDYINGKFVTSLLRTHWKDSLLNEQYLRSNILLLDTDGTNERIMELME